MDSQSGPTWIRGQIIDRHQMPHECWEYVHDSSVPLKQPIDGATREPREVRMHERRLAYAQTLWNQKLGAFQSIVSMSYVTTGSAMRGVLGQIRTQLVDLIADLTADTPLTELPHKEQVDAAVGRRIGDVYNTTINGADGPVAMGGKAKAKAEGLTVADAMKLLDEVQELAGEVKSGRSELLDAIVDIREAVEQDSPDTGDVIKKVRRIPQDRR